MVMSGCTTSPQAAPPGGLPLRAGSIRIQKALRSWKAIRQANVVMQSRDYSCGSAALATLMRYYFDDDKTEADILENILGFLTPEEITERQQNGLSMLDLKRCAERMGYQAVGVKLPVSALPKLKGPVLIHLAKGDYEHFAVLRGIRDDRVYLADPIRGNVQVRIWRFDKEWTGTALVLGREGFGLPQDHGLSLSAKVPVQDYRMALRRARRIPQLDLTQPSTGLH